VECGSVIRVAIAAASLSLVACSGAAESVCDGPVRPGVVCVDGHAVKVVGHSNYWSTSEMEPLSNRPETGWNFELIFQDGDHVQSSIYPLRTREECETKLATARDNNARLGNTFQRAECYEVVTTRRVPGAPYKVWYRGENRP